MIDLIIEIGWLIGSAISSITIINLPEDKDVSISETASWLEKQTRNYTEQHQNDPAAKRGFPLNYFPGEYFQELDEQELDEIRS